MQDRNEDKDEDMCFNKKIILQEYNISDTQPFLSNSWKMKQKFTFFRYIATGLPNRLLISVYNRFNMLFGNCLDKSR